MSTFDEVFTNEEAVVVDSTEKEGKKAEKKEKIAEMKSLFKKTIQEDPSYLDRRQTLSDSLKVVKTLGYTASGNVVVDKEATAKKKAEDPEAKKVLKSTGKVVGYTIQNVGEAAISYITEVFAQDETGKYVGTKVEKTLAPGESANISRSYLAMLAAKPEFAFKLANGTLTSRSTPKGGVEEILSRFYFSFDKELGLGVNDDEVKVTIDKDGVVAPEYIEAFGYLNNPKEKKSTGSGSPKFTTQELMANYINSLVQGAE